MVTTIVISNPASMSQPEFTICRRSVTAGLRG
jgi:hypothetical protein